jgi:hypothetical protein
MSLNEYIFTCETLEFYCLVTIKLLIFNELNKL